MSWRVELNCCFATGEPGSAVAEARVMVAIADEVGTNNDEAETVKRAEKGRQEEVKKEEVKSIQVLEVHHSGFSVRRGSQLDPKAVVDGG